MLLEFPNFLDVDLCKEFISIADSKLKPAKTLGEHIEGYRVADSCWLLDTEFQVSFSYRNKVADLLKLPLSFMENLHIVRYQIGGEYKNHHDFFHQCESYYDECVKRGGQRTHTALLYLNDDFEGGETDFPELQRKIKPEVGKLVVWTNLNEDETPRYESLHAGLPVISGVKYISTIWIRQSDFI